MMVKLLTGPVLILLGIGIYYVWFNNLFLSTSSSWIFVRFFAPMIAGLLIFIGIGVIGSRLAHWVSS